MAKVKGITRIYSSLSPAEKALVSAACGACKPRSGRAGLTFHMRFHPFKPDHEVRKCDSCGQEWCVPLKPGA